MSWRRTEVRRKIAAATWRPSRDGRIYARLEVDVGPAREYCRRVSEKAGVQVTVTHVVGAALARVLREVPEFRARMVFGRVVPLEQCDIAFAVDIEGGSDLAPIKVRRADTLTPVEIARVLQRGAERLRAGRDEAYGKTSRLVEIAPAWAIRPVLAMSSVISGGLGKPAFGQPGFPLGTAFVSNVGTVGLDEAFLAPPAVRPHACLPRCRGHPRARTRHRRRDRRAADHRPGRDRRPPPRRRLPCGRDGRGHEAAHRRPGPHGLSLRGTRSVHPRRAPTRRAGPGRRARCRPWRYPC
ncbi:hypothetical protein GA707_04960 [Nostocoides sp. F2B08]|nr:hypothetical protein GA707_04960 [Tetrasphaera sp. F2B08]